jgi:hypothetical protein
MVVQNETHRSLLLALAEEDRRVRAELARDGSLFTGYHPRMEAVHLSNTRALGELLADGWPKASAVGEDGQQAAWLIAQHAISFPHFQRRCRELLREAVGCGEAPAWQFAMLTDRIRVFEGQPQLYGTQFDWDDNGELSPLPIEDAASVDQRRDQVGLEPLADAMSRHRRNAQESGEHPPPDRNQHRAEQETWLKRVGWR